MCTCPALSSHFYPFLPVSKTLFLKSIQHGSVCRFLDCLACPCLFLMLSCCCPLSLWTLQYAILFYSCHNLPPSTAHGHWFSEWFCSGSTSSLDCNSYEPRLWASGSVGPWAVPACWHSGCILVAWTRSCLSYRKSLVRAYFLKTLCRTVLWKVKMLIILSILLFCFVATRYWLCVCINEYCRTFTF